jgi:transcriptional regulator with XRE-family HTH domain
MTGPADSHRHSLGLRLKALRKLQGLSLNNVADQTGVSTSFLSLVERGETDMSLDRFRTLADFFHVSPSELLLENPNGRGPTVAAFEAATTVDRGPGVDYRIVQAENPQIIWIRFAPRARFLDFRAHPGIDVCLVTQGEVELLYGEDRHLVGEGQFVRFSATTPHAFENTSDRPAELIALGTVPYW